MPYETRTVQSPKYYGWSKAGGTAIIFTIQYLGIPNESRPTVNIDFPFYVYFNSIMCDFNNAKDKAVYLAYDITLCSIKGSNV